MTVKIAHPNPHGSLSEDRLVKFENQFALQLPTDYRDFLLDNNGGRPVPSFFWINAHQAGATVHHFYGLYDRIIPTSMELHMGSDRRGIPASMLPIGDDGTGNLICIGLGWGEFGRVYFLDRELRPRDAAEGLQGITLIANSFSEFLSGLLEAPEQ